MTEKPKQPNLLWPAITDMESAISASDSGYGAAIVVAVMTAAFATYAVISGNAIASLDAWSYLDSAVFAFIAWRIRRRSRVFAVIGLLFFLLEKIVQYSESPPASGGAVVAVFIALYFVSGIRGTFAVHRLRSTGPSGPDPSPKVDV